MKNTAGIKKFRDAKLGLFLHWGVYAVRSRGEWSIFRDNISKDDYKKYMKMFNPVRFNAEEWVLMAKNAGLNYICITSKHHDGFCLFDSKYTDWKITNSPFKRDIIKELADACHKHNILFGIYYSIWDIWHEGLDGGMGDMEINGQFDKESGWKPSKEGVEYMHNQVEELLTNYGKVDYFFFDVRRAPGEDYDGDALIEKMRKWQPDMVINDRLGVEADCKSPENYIPDEPLVDEDGDLVLWESNMCSNKNWGYVHDDKSFKTKKQVQDELVGAVTKGGNYLINIGPTALGEFPKENVKMLKELGEWLDYHGEAVYGCEMQPIKGGGKHFRWGKIGATTNENGDVYLFITNPPAGGRTDSKIVIPKFEGREVDYMVLLEDGCEVEFLDYGYYGKGYGSYTIITPYLPRDENSVIKVVFK